MQKFKHQKEYENKMREMGFKRITLWVPDEDIEELRAIAKEMREEKEAAMVAAKT